MKLPRDMGGEELAALLGRYGYKIIRQTGSHMRLTSTSKGFEHHIHHSQVQTSQSRHSEQYRE